MSKMKNLERDIRIAHENNVKYLIVGIVCYGAKEMIMINREDFMSKLEYYKKTYGDDLVMKTNKDIRIATYMFSDKVIIEQLDITKA